MIIKSWISALLSFCIMVKAVPQVYERPATGIRTHETMEILKAEVTPSKTVLYLCIENRREGGEFCAARDIYISGPDGSRLNIVSATGIPRCPEVYRFKKTGEKLYFSLEFPPLKNGTGWINLVENCNDYCFRIYGILLDNGFSRKIDEALSMAERGESDSAITLYKDLIRSSEKRHEGIIGSLYADLITLLVNKGYTAQASEYYKQIIASSFPEKQLYIDNLNSRGIRF